ncbi:MAG: hypothetical protein B6I17_01025 [Tenericutes bacterium 4572_104]|nr:MAG: hypothetical protein B6I17_01025 [Tenericutes bacterium 4572_104]
MIKGLYIHIPFCDQICSYCDFTKMVANKEIKEKYINALIQELRHYKEYYKDLKTIYIGGGTPSSLEINLLEKLLVEINNAIDVSLIEEFSIETNPNDININLLDLFYKYGVNRISVGVQTLSDKGCIVLSRNHKREDIIKAIEVIQESSITNYNLDFIYGFPYQTIESLKKDIQFIEKYKPPHISYYSLIIEDNTILGYNISKNIIKPLDDDLIADYAIYINGELKKQGYVHYEFSNFARNNLYSKHNMIYWDLEEYIGIGLNASSFYNNRRYINPNRITDYFNSVFNRKYYLEEEPCVLDVEFVLMGLRKLKGIDILEFKERFNINIFERFPGLKKFLGSNLLVLEDNYLHFTEKGVLLSNQVYLEII